MCRAITLTNDIRPININNLLIELSSQKREMSTHSAAVSYLRSVYGDHAFCESPNFSNSSSVDRTSIPNMHPLQPLLQDHRKLATVIGTATTLLFISVGCILYFHHLSPNFKPVTGNTTTLI